MPVTHQQARMSWLPIMVSNTILPNRAKLNKSGWFTTYVQSPWIQSFRPCMKEELFNLQHTSACNVIKHIFGVLKHKFWILLIDPEYSLEIQAHIPAVLAAVHNFICHHEPGEDETINNREPISGMIENDDGGLMEGWVNKMWQGIVLPMWCGSNTKANMLPGGFLPLVEYREEHECFLTYLQIYCLICYPTIEHLWLLSSVHRCKCRSLGPPLFVEHINILWHIQYNSNETSILHQLWYL